ncbi:signal recognition particle 54 kDa protein-like protein [Neoconidiobolus thromboides FSU 785]|nr:signal recognition particle 54 kDa protein-like protein [Neoconidiobolus thromboides FSU 785]
MVLNELGGQISAALKSLNNTNKVDEKVLDDILKEICSALLKSDVNITLVQKLRNNVKNSIKKELNTETSVTNKKRLIQKSVMDELKKLVDPGVPAWEPKKGKCNIVMFVGLQGSGKTTSITKLSYYYQRKNWKVGLICADTFRAGAFDQLKQNATKANIPYYGSYTEADPVKIALDGVTKFKKDNFDLIMVDTSGRHKQEQELFDEMVQISNTVNPDHTIFVMDAHMGQSADSQARAFKSVVDVGSIVLTKMDGHAKGGGAISAVAATQSPILFIGTGEHIYDLDRFEPNGFISSMLGMGNLGALMETVQDLNLQQTSEDLFKKIGQGHFSLRDMKQQFETISKLGPLNKVMGMMPGMPKEMIDMMDKSGGQDQIKMITTLMDSMTDAELDSDSAIFDQQPNRKRRLAQGSGSSIIEVDRVIAQYRQFSAMIKRMGGSNGLFSQLGLNPNDPKGNMDPNKMKKVQENMSRMMGGGGMPDMSKMMQQMMGGGGGGMPDMSQMMQSMMGGGGGGMPDMSQMMQQMSSMFGGGGGMPDMSSLMGGMSNPNPNKQQRKR